MRIDIRPIGETQDAEGSIECFEVVPADAQYFSCYLVNDGISEWICDVKTKEEANRLGELIENRDTNQEESCQTRPKN